MSSSAKFGFISLILYAINSIVGSGIFLLPQRAYSLIGSGSLVVIFFIAVLVLSMACCFAEASGRFKENGGAFVYAREAFGDFVGFEVGFMRYIVSITSWATLAVAFATLLGTLFPAFAAPAVIKVISAMMVLTYGFINYRGVRASEVINNLSTVCKLVPLALFVGIGVFYIDPANLNPVQSMESMTQSTFASGVILLFYAFGGFESIPVAAEEMDNPEKNMPRGMILGVSIVALIYLLILGVTIGLLGSGVSDSSAPIAEAARVVMGDFGFMMVSIGSLLSILGINLAASFAAPRSLVALANHKMVPASLTQHNRYGVPGSAILLTTVLTLAVALSGSFAQLAALSVVARFAQYLPTCFAVLVFRKRFEKPSTFTIPGGPIVPVLAIVTGFWLIFNAPVNNLIFGVIGLIVGVPFYMMTRKQRMASQSA